MYFLNNRAEIRHNWSVPPLCYARRLSARGSIAECGSPNVQCISARVTSQGLWGHDNGVIMQLGFIRVYWILLHIHIAVYSIKIRCILFNMPEAKEIDEKNGETTKESWGIDMELWIKLRWRDKKPLKVAFCMGECVFCRSYRAPITPHQIRLVNVGDLNQINKVTRCGLERSTLLYNMIHSAQTPLH